MQRLFQPPGTRFFLCTVFVILGLTLGLTLPAQDRALIPVAVFPLIATNVPSTSSASQIDSLIQEATAGVPQPTGGQGRFELTLIPTAPDDPDIPPELDTVQGLPYALTSMLFYDAAGQETHTQVWLYDMITERLIVTDEMLYGNLEEAQEFLPFLIDYIMTRIPMSLVYTLEVSAAEGGAVLDSQGVPVTGSIVLEGPAEVLLNAWPAAGYQFDGWAINGGAVFDRAEPLNLELNGETYPDNDGADDHATIITVEAQFLRISPEPAAEDEPADTGEPIDDPDPAAEDDPAGDDDPIDDGDPAGDGPAGDDEGAAIDWYLSFQYAPVLPVFKDFTSIMQASFFPFGLAARFSIMPWHFSWGSLGLELAVSYTALNIRNETLDFRTEGQQFDFALNLLYQLPLQNIENLALLLNLGGGISWVPSLVFYYDTSVPPSPSYSILGFLVDTGFRARVNIWEGLYFEAGAEFATVFYLQTRPMGYIRFNAGLGWHF
jgi:hypothetical protein